MLRKGRNRDRAHPQRRNPNPKRRKLDDTAGLIQEGRVTQPWTIPEQEKRKVEEEERPRS